MGRGCFCEIQGEHVPLKYRSQRNHICVNSDQRKLFRGAKAVLKIEVFVEIFGNTPGVGAHGVYYSPYDLAMRFRGRVNAWLRDLKQRKGEDLRIVYKYELHVEGEALRGRFHGVYQNHSLCKSAVIRRIRRMVGPSLVIEDNTLRSRRKLVRNWKLEQYDKAWAFYQDRVKQYKEKQRQKELQE